MRGFATDTTCKYGTPPNINSSSNHPTIYQLQAQHPNHQLTAYKPNASNGQRGSTTVENQSHVALEPSTRQGNQGTRTKQ